MSGGASWGLLVVVLLLAPSAAADWLQDGGDAARTGAVPGAAPEYPDVAFEIELPPLEGNAPTAQQPAPLFIGGQVYVARVRNVPGDQFGLESPALIHVDRVDPVSAAVTPVVDVEIAPTATRGVLAAGITSDGERLFLHALGHIVAVPVGGGAPLWDVDMRLTGQPFTPACAHMAVRDGVLFVACVQPTAAFAHAVTFVNALDVATGTPVWDRPWFRDGNTAPSPSEPDQALGWALAATTGPQASAITTQVRGVAVIGGLVLVPIVDGPNTGCTNNPVRSPAYSTYVWAIGATTGEDVWRVQSTAYQHVLNRFVLGTGDCVNAPPVPTGDGEWAFIKLEGIVRRSVTDPAAPAVTTSYRGTASYEGDLGSGMAFARGALYATSRTTLFRMDKDLDHEWKFPLPEDEAWAAGGLAVAGETVLGKAAAETGVQSLYGIDARRGAARWSYEFENPVQWAVSDGLVAAVDQAGRLLVLGRTRASIGVAVPDAGRFPAPGETVRRDLSGTSPGAFGPATSYRAEWGDGEVSDWQPSPILDHRYSAPDDYAARVFARNDANQTASALVVFSVGGSPPLNAIQAAFADENQEKTFFVLGLLITGAVAAIGVLRLRRQRDRLKNEIASVENAYAMTKERPRDCEAALAERKAHCRGLLLDGKVDEAQFAILQRRIEELAGEARLSTLDDDFDFLTIGMGKTLREMLADGVITRWEHRNFVEALERDALLTTQQKAKVRALIDAWFARDAGRREGRA